MTCLQRDVVRNIALCGAVVAMALMLSACDRRPQAPTEENWLDPQTRPAQSEQQEQAPVAPEPEREAPTWQPETEE